eukprot:TRINITY_DN2872_c0_g1_i8.p2 TRINITY_DN2872_c0_g1~~TRINITY_DN2872_c0_g1_i8.p2  ORF type:complete len:167 (+),score=18.29 TRINITY_DN2872_c0_g1_i8:544-1044(+)
MSTAYKGQAFLSVMRRSEAFREQLQRIQPHLTKEMCFAMWVQRLRDEKRLSPSSALQYMTYFSQAERSPFQLLRRSLSRKLSDHSAHEDKMARVPTMSAVKEVIPKRGILAGALSLQLASVCRWVDLKNLLVKHVEQGHHDTPKGSVMLTFVGGKTDLSRRPGAWS